MLSESLITRKISLLMNSWEIENFDKMLLRDLKTLFCFPREFYHSAKVNKKHHQASTDLKDSAGRFCLEKCE